MAVYLTQTPFMQAASHGANGAAINTDNDPRKILRYLVLLG